MSEYHVPVMLRECIDALNLKQNGTYIDVTFGAGGHSKLILKELNGGGKLYAFDQDADAEKNAGLQDENFVFIKSNFRHLARFMKYYGAIPVDGILADLGVSSHQLDFPERGFSYRYDADLDMRMNFDSKLTATLVLNEYGESELQDVFSKYGEVRNARTLAKRIVQKRGLAKIKTTFQLNQILDEVKFGTMAKYFAQVYQALRIEVNEEIKVLEEMLEAGGSCLRPGGRFVVMSYHSLEDRVVKNYFKTGNVAGEVVKDDFGKIERPFKLINKKVIVATPEELKRNSRARSAKLRIAEKL